MIQDLWPILSVVEFAGIVVLGAAVWCCGTAANRWKERCEAFQKALNYADKNTSEMWIEKRRLTAFRDAVVKLVKADLA